MCTVLPAPLLGLSATRVRLSCLSQVTVVAAHGDVYLVLLTPGAL